jgi:hypothetical protein
VILDRTRNFVALCQAAADHLPAWRTYHEWCALALLSAVAGPRVEMRLIRTEPLRPTLYVFLVGPPGAGKGVAIDFSLACFTAAERRLAPLVAHIPERQRPAIVPDLLGNITMPALWKTLAHEHHKSEGAQAPEFLRGLPPQLWYTCEELAQALDAHSPLTRDLLTFLTGMYSISPRKRSNVTKTAGVYRIASPAITWLTGTTIEWLKMAVPPDVIAGGFTSRVIFVVGGRPPKRRIIEPSDYLAVMRYLTSRLIALLTTVRGVFSFADAAAEDYFYHQREAYEAEVAADEDVVQKALVREDVLLLKLAMLGALADEVDTTGSGDLIISKTHLAQAHESVIRARIGVKHVLGYLITSSKDADAMQFILDVVRRAGRDGLWVRDLTAQTRRRGITGEQLQSYLRTLAGSEEVRVGSATPGGQFVRIGRVRTLPRET